ncbi:MAG: hypothetical protein AMS24_01725 [Chlamydiae bacterium SM23_39]|nr:MAG: hypothetical protein AMS24_01725 [Chlamydiae bacterium SM23_39]
MLYDVVEVKVIKDYTLYLRFENGVQGKVDISKIIPFKGIFSKLQDKEYFATVYVNNELGTIVWDNGADISPSCLYSAISHKVA